MVQGLKIQVHFKIDLISAPGTLISETHGDVYINVRLFNTHFRHGLLKSGSNTQLKKLQAEGPLLLNEFLN